MAVYGYRPPGGGAAPDSGVTGSGVSNQRASVFDKMVEPGWAYQISARVGRAGSTSPTVALAIWGTSGGMNPTTLARASDTFSASTSMTSGSGGAVHTKALPSAFQLRNNARYGLGFLATGAALGHGMIAAGSISAENEQFYYRSVASQPPTDPFGATSQSVEGHLAVWVDYEANVKPDVPSSLSPADGATIATLTPTFQGSFDDDNSVLPNGLAGDSLNRVQIVVQRVSDGANMWGDSGHTYEASGDERDAELFTAVYDGAALSSGVEYRWKARVSDQFDAWSDYTDWRTFTVGAGSVSTSSGTPTGKQETRTPGPFTGVWSHGTPLSTNAVQVRIKSGSTVIRTSGTIAKTVANGGTISVTWAETGFGQLDWGGSYTYEIRGRDTANAWSGWSSGRSFTVNAAPAVPSQLTPGSGLVITALPLLSCKATDADDTTSTGLAVTARIKDSAGVVLQARAMTYNSTSGKWEYQTVPADLPSFATYRWAAYSHDGTVYSGGATVVGSATESPEASFVYAEGPTVTVSSPTEDEVVTTATPAVAWTTTDQQSYQIRVYDADTGDLLWDTGEVIDSVTASLPIASGILSNGDAVFVKVRVRNGLGLYGESAARPFSLIYPEPPVLSNFVVSDYYADGDANATAVLVSWDPTEYEASEFVRYRVTRQPTDGSLLDVDDPDGTGEKEIASLTSPVDTVYVDASPASGITYTYRVRQVVTVEGETLTSPAAEADITLSFDETVISDARNGLSRRAVLRYRGERSVDRKRDQALLQPWNSTRPTVLRSNVWYREIPGEYVIHADTPDEVEAIIYALNQMDRSGGPLLYRDGRRRRYFGEITAFREIDPPGGRLRRVTLTFSQTNAVEGASS